MSGLKRKYRTVDPAVKQLELENERLKKIVPKQALEFEFKDALLKKRR
jgi:putative transposase